MPRTISPLLGLPWELADAPAGDGDMVQAEDTNRPAHVLENSLANVLLRHLTEDGFINRSPSAPNFDQTAVRIAVPTPIDPIVGFAFGRGFIMDSTMEQSATADSGDTTSLIDAERTEGDNFWNDGYILFTSGVNSGQIRRIIAFSEELNQITWSGAVPAAVGIGDTYTVTFYYVQGLTNNAINYIFGRVLGRTARDGVIQWVANTTGAAATGDILAMTVTIDAGGAVTAVDLYPYGHNRNLWTGAGAVHELIIDGTIMGLPGSSYVDVTRTHPALILLGPISIEISNVVPDAAAGSVSIEIIRWYRSSQLTFRITNDSPYVVENLDYEIRRRGRRWVYL